MPSADPVSVILQNTLLFIHLLRRAGVNIDLDRVQLAHQALKTVGVSHRADVRTALKSTLLSRQEQHAIFDQVFELFWRDPKWLERSIAQMLPQIPVPKTSQPKMPGEARVRDALKASAPSKQEIVAGELEIDARGSFSSLEMLRQKDFAQMSAGELLQIKQALRTLPLALPNKKLRRWRPSNTGKRLHPRATSQQALRTGGEIFKIARARPVTVSPPLTVLCDISGSMSVYARMILQFMHGVTQARKQSGFSTHTFLFATRLTNVTQSLLKGDPDAAIEDATSRTLDWDGGTRLGGALGEFYMLWSRRVLRRHATVLLVTDGLERDDLEHLQWAAERIHRAAKRVIWLNPLLRYDGFAPKAQGIKILLNHVDELRPIHNLQSMEDLAGALMKPGSYNELKKFRALAA